MGRSRRFSFIRSLFWDIVYLLTILLGIYVASLPWGLRYVKQSVKHIETQQCLVTITQADISEVRKRRLVQNIATAYDGNGDVRQHSPKMCKASPLVTSLKVLTPLSTLVEYLELEEVLEPIIIPGL